MHTIEQKRLQARELDPLPTIPTPLSLRWREYRIRFMPLFMFVALLFACSFFWTFATRRSTLAGVGEGVRSTVCSPQAGLVQELRVQPFQLVSEGEPIALVVPVDPRAELDLLRTEVQLAQMRMQPSLVEQNAMDYERMRMEMLRLKSEVAIAQVNLERTDAELRRRSLVYKEGVISEDVYELALKTRDAYKAEVEQKSNSMAEIQKRLALLRPLGEPETSGASNVLYATMAKLEQAQATITTNRKGLTLLAPISGMISVVNRRAGEYIPEGEALVVINGLTSDKIIGYLRQPYAMDPEVGFTVQVSTRTRDKKTFTSQITQIGAHLEIITNNLAFLPQGALADMGLPIVVTVPKEVIIRPGETVDIFIKKPKMAGKNRLTEIRGDRVQENQPL